MARATFAITCIAVHSRTKIECHTDPRTEARDGLAKSQNVTAAEEKQIPSVIALPATAGFCESAKDRLVLPHD